MRLTRFGHSAFRAELNATRILIDPFLFDPTFIGLFDPTFTGDKRAIMPERGKKFIV